MAWVKFSGDYDYRAKPSVTIAYKSGHSYNVTSTCATLAVAAGKAVRMDKPTKDAEPTEAKPAAVVMPPETKVETHGAI